MKGWEKVRLGSLISEHGGVIQTGPFGSQLHESDYSETGIPVVMPKDIIDGKISEVSTAKISEDIFRQLRRHRLNKGDIVIPRRGNFDKRAIITDREDGWFCGTGCLKIAVSQTVLSPDYFYYYLSQRDVVEHIESQAIGSTLLNLSGSIVNNFVIPLPPLRLQRRIADILSRYDSLIDNYHRQITALENMAQEIYREWFVRGRCPYAEPGEEGGLPLGWDRKPVEDCFQILGGGTPSREDSNFWEDGTINWFTPTDITGSGGFFLRESSEKITETGLNSSSARLFPAYSVMMTSRATIGAVAINTQQATTNQGFIVCLPNEQFSFAFIYFWVTHNKHIFEMLAGGATFLEIPKGIFKKINIVTPSFLELVAFDKIAIPIFKKIENLQTQLTTLCQTRDALLPRLLSGQLAVGDTLAD